MYSCIRPRCGPAGRSCLIDACDESLIRLLSHLPIIAHLGENAMSVKNKEPYQQSYYPPMPTPFVRYLRRSLPWQFFRFWTINYKIFKLLRKSSH